jgi:tetratricopeptide (TPR) repeat protein
LVEKTEAGFVKVIERLTCWGEKVAVLWARYWLLLIASGFVLLSVVLKWVEFPFSRNLKGLQLSLFHDAGLIPHLTLFSFGFLGVAVLIGGIIFSRFSAAFLGAAAAVLLTIFALVPAQLAFAQPSMLQRLTEETEVTPLIKAFSKTYLPQNYGASEDVPKRLNLYSGWGRFVAAWSFLRLGWYCFGIGSLLLGGYAIIRLREQKLPVLLALFGLPLAAVAIVLAPAMVGQYYYTRASLAKAEGRNEEAITAFRKSMTWDRWHTQDIELYATIGDLERLSGLSEDSPERHVSRAAHLEKANQYEQAIFELETASKAGGALGVAARRETARLHMMFGLALYQAGGVGSAVTNWQQALAVDPSQFYSLPYLARGYFQIGSYEAAVQTVEQVIKIVKDHNSLLGDAYSLGGDSYAKLGRVAEARKYYNLSLLADPIENYWALTGLVGE